MGNPRSGDSLTGGKRDHLLEPRLVAGTSTRYRADNTYSTFIVTSLGEDIPELSTFSQEHVRVSYCNLLISENNNLTTLNVSMNT